MSQLFFIVMKNHHNKMKTEQAHLLLHLMIWSCEKNHQMEQQVNLLHFDEEWLDADFKNHKKFARDTK